MKRFSSDEEEVEEFIMWSWMKKWLNDKEVVEVSSNLGVFVSGNHIITPHAHTIKQ